MYEQTRSQPQFKTLIYEGELDRIAGWVKEYPDRETGGDAWGFWTHSGAPVVQFVLGPGEMSRHNSASFFQDRDYLIKAGEILRETHGLQHIGEWHSHHQLGLAQPSGGDENTVFKALEKYNFPRFLLCIANLEHASSRKKGLWKVNIGSFLFTHSKPRYQVGAWVVLPGESPIRSCLTHKKFFTPPKKLSNDWQVERTTLEAEILVSTQPIEISKGLWYANPEGQALLKEIYTEMKQKFNCQMYRTPEEQIYFSFERGREAWRIELPDDFPQSPPLFTNDGQVVNARGERWTPNSKLIEFFLKCSRNHGAYL